MSFLLFFFIFYFLFWVKSLYFSPLRQMKWENISFHLFTIVAHAYAFGSRVNHIYGSIFIHKRFQFLCMQNAKKKKNKNELTYARNSWILLNLTSSSPSSSSSFITIIISIEQNEKKTTTWTKKVLFPRQLPTIDPLLCSIKYFVDQTSSHSILCYSQNIISFNVNGT